MKTNQKLNLFQGISVSIGSIIGSGVLFLPSMTVSHSGGDALLAWSLILILTLSGLFFFREILNDGDESGISGFVSNSLGDVMGASISLILLGTVIFGMPSACMIVGDYVSQIFPIEGIVKLLVAVLIILATIVLCMRGVKTSAKVNSFVSILLVTTAAVICSFSTYKIEVFKVPEFALNIKSILQSSVLAFWAFAGFENLTYLRNDFENPSRDLFPSIVIAILVCASIYLCLTYDIIMLIPHSRINPSTGLMQLSSLFPNANYFKVVIAVFAFFSVFMNMISWTSGIANAVVSASADHMLPIIFKEKTNGIPQNAIKLLGCAFVINTIIGSISPEIFSKMLSLVSSNFLVVYLIIVVAVAFKTNNRFKKIISLILAAIIVGTLSSFTFLLIYPILIILLTFIIKRKVKK